MRCKGKRRQSPPGAAWAPCRQAPAGSSPTTTKPPCSYSAPTCCSCPAAWPRRPTSAHRRSSATSEAQVSPRTTHQRLLSPTAAAAAPHRERSSVPKNAAPRGGRPPLLQCRQPAGAQAAGGVSRRARQAAGGGEGGRWRARIPSRYRPTAAALPRLPRTRDCPASLLVPLRRLRLCSRTCGPTQPPARVV